MDAENPQVSDQSGEPELPIPTFSETGASSTSTDADAIVSKLTPILEQIVERKVQSVKDKRFSEIEKALGGRAKMLAELEEMGTEIPKDVRSELRIRDLEERLTQASPQPVQVGDNGLSQQKAAVTDAIAELNKYDLDSNNAGFIEILRGKYPNREAFDLNVQRYVVSKLAPQKPANPADVVQSPVTAGATGNNAADKIAQLQQLQKTPTRNRAQIEKLTKELDAINWGGLT
jgi:hypothetical protein